MPITHRPADQPLEPIITRFAFGARGGVLRGGVNVGDVSFPEVPREIAMEAAEAFRQRIAEYIESGK